MPAVAGVAQLVEQRICNPQVTGSSPIASSSAGSGGKDDGRQWAPALTESWNRAGVAERSMAADCKSAGATPTVVRIHPPAPSASRGSNSGVESQPSKLLVAGSIPVSRSMFLAGWPAHVAQQVEHVLGKDGVTSSSLDVGSSMSRIDRGRVRPATVRGARLESGRNETCNDRKDEGVASGRHAETTVGPSPRGPRPLLSGHAANLHRGRRKGYGQAEV